jgi:large repetitive protein
LNAGTYNFSFDDGCLSNTLTQNISDPSAQATPIITASGTTIFCSGGSVVLTSSPANSYLWSSGETTQSITITTSGNYSVTATNTAGCSAGSAATSVTVNAAPSIALGTVVNPSTCGASDGAIQITGSGTGTISWSGSTSGSASTTLPYTLTGLNAGTYNFSFHDGCLSNTLTQNISDPSAQATPIITASGTTTFCSGGSVVLTSSPANSYLWSGGETTQSITVTTSGNYSVTATNTAGCSSTSAITSVNIISAPIITAGTLTNPSICGATDGSIQISGSGVGVVYWSGTANGNSGSVTLPYLISDLGQGSYNIRFDDGCLSDTLFSSLSDPGAPATPTISASGVTTFCSGGSVTLTSSSTSGNVWSTGETTQTIIVTSSGTFNVTNSISGCSTTSANVNVIVNNTPVLAQGTTINPSLCNSLDGTIEIIGSATGNISWSGTSSGSVTNITLPYLISGLGAGLYNIDFLSTSGCSSNTITTNLVDPATPPIPTITANGATTFCAGSSVVLTSSAVSNNVWSTGETTQSIVVNSSGTYDVDVIVSGCISSSAVTSVTVNTVPSITLGNVTNPSVCGMLDGSIEILGSGTGDITWNGSSSGSSTSVTLPFIISNLGQGSYNIEFNDGCNSNSLIPVLNDPGAPTTPLISTSGPTTFCDGGSVILSSSYPTGNTWSNGETTQSITVVTAGNYNVTVESSGCSSTSSNELVSINNISTSIDTQIACDNYTWMDGVTYTSSNNTATFVLTNAVGCDSIVTLNLTINNSNTVVDTQVACGTYTWIDGNTYTESNNTATFTLTNATGCDSIVNLNLIINNSSLGVDTQVACDTYTWIDGNTYTTSNNTATFALINAAGCDSIITLNLTINNIATSVDTQVSCGSYTWIDGITYTESNNIATFIIPNGSVNGCDSIITLDLTIIPVATSNDVQVTCGSFTWIDGITYTESNNIATFIIPNGSVNGCDSIITLDLTIIPVATGNDVQVTCGSFTWIDGITYTESNNTATFTIPNGAVNGCDSIISLNLTINNPTNSIDTQVSCGSFTWIDGNTYTSNNNSAIFTMSNGSVTGCDSIITLNLTIISKPDVFATQTYAVCESESLILSASSVSQTILWFSSESAQNEISEGAVFETPVLNSTITYYVEARENGCRSDRLPITINVNSKPQINLTSTNANCGNTEGSASASIIGGATPYTYYWSNGEQGVLDIFNLATGSYYFNVEDNNGCKSMAATEVTPFSISFNPTIVNPTCFGDNNGSINLNVTNFPGQLTYLWNNGGSSSFIKDLVAGTYEVTVTNESGCVVTSSFQIVQPQKISFDFSSVQPDCGVNNGQIQLINVNGGSGTYIYNWSTGQAASTLNNLTYGIYAVSVVDQNNCFETKSIMLSEKNAPIIEAVVTNPNCNQSNGAIDLNITPINGFNVATISWSNGQTSEDITNISKGYYTSIVTTTNNCIAVNGWIVNNKLPEVQELCLVTVDSVTTTNLVVWEKPQSSEISHYNIYRESNQINDYQLIDTVQYSNLSVFNDVVASPKVRSWRYKIAAVDYCGGVSPLSLHHKTVHLNTFNLGASGTKITWDKYEGNQAFSSYLLWRYTNETGWEMISSLPTSVVNFTDNILASTEGLDYMIEVEIDEKCTATKWRAQDFDVSRSNKNKGLFNPGNGVNDYSNNNVIEFDQFNSSIKVYPNPFENKLTFDLKGSDNIDIEIIDVSGKLILTTNCREGITPIDLTHVQDGVYFIKTKLNKEIKTIKIVKQ